MENELPKSKHRCIPLCYPDNYRWLSEEGSLVEIKDRDRTRLIPCEEAMEILEGIDMPVCIAAAVGDRRTGKSYIVSQLQEPRADECVFGISSGMKACTVGIWMSGQPFVKTLQDGNKVAMILLDTEGMGSIETMGDKDDHIFLLTILITSLLIYNGKDIPKAEDLTKLRCIGDLATRIQTKAGEMGHDKNEKVEAGWEEFYKFFPNFFWLLRDVLLSPVVEKDGEEVEVEIKEYLLTEVLQRKEGANEHSQKLAEMGRAILKYFPCFEAHALPPPSSKREVVKNIEKPEYKKMINSEFLDGVEEFIKKAKLQLKPKLAWPSSGYVYGKQMSQMISIYAKAIAEPGVMPNVESTWDQIIRLQFKEAVDNAYEAYKAKMINYVESVVPCNPNELSKQHDVLFKESSDKFYADTNSISDTQSVDKYYTEFKNRIVTYKGEDVSGGLLRMYLQHNITKSEEMCQLLIDETVTETLGILEATYLESYEEVETIIDSCQKKYVLKARGPRSTAMQKQITEKFMEYYFANIEMLSKLPGFKTPEMTKEKKRQFEAHLTALEEKEIAKEMAETAKRMQEETEIQRQMFEEKAKKEAEIMENQMKEQKQNLENQLANLKDAHDGQLAIITNKFEKQGEEDRQRNEEKDKENQLAMNNMTEKLEKMGQKNDKERAEQAKELREEREKAHQREIDMLERSHEHEIVLHKQTSDMQEQSHKHEIEQHKQQAEFERKRLEAEKCKDQQNMERSHKHEIDLHKQKTEWERERYEADKRADHINMEQSRKHDIELQKQKADNQERSRKHELELHQQAAASERRRLQAEAEAESNKKGFFGKLFS